MTVKNRKWPLPGDPDASVGARHHRVPRFYLERFANERLQIATMDRRTGERRTAAIRETAAEKDFYTAINTDGDKDGKSEHLLSHIEGNAARAIRNILVPAFRLFPPQPQDRADLCLFLAFQKVRGKQTRKRIEMLGDLWARAQFPANMSDEQAADWLRANGQEATPESIAEMVDFSGHMDEFQFVPDPNEHLRVMGDTALRISELLLPRPWYIADYGTPALLTSDEPVALHFRDASRPPGHDRGIAYADEIWFPLDPRRLLILGLPGDPAPEQYLHPPVETAATPATNLPAEGPCDPKPLAELKSPCRDRPPPRIQPALAGFAAVAVTSSRRARVPYDDLSAARRPFSVSASARAGPGCPARRGLSLPRSLHEPAAASWHPPQAGPAAHSSRAR